MKQFIVITAGATLFAFAGAGCASNRSDVNGAGDQTVDERALTHGESKAGQTRNADDDNRVVEGPGGAMMIVHDEDDWVQEQVHVPDGQQTEN